MIGDYDAHFNKRQLPCSDAFRPSAVYLYTVWPILKWANFCWFSCPSYFSLSAFTFCYLYAWFKALFLMYYSKWVKAQPEEQDCWNCSSDEMWGRCERKVVLSWSGAHGDEIQLLVSLWIALALKVFLLRIENTSLSVSEISNLTYGVTSVKGLLV